MSRADLIGFFWDDYKPPKVVVKKVERIPPEPTWLADDYLPYLEESLRFDVPMLTRDELIEERSLQSLLAFDIECYPNYFLVAFKSLRSGKVIYLEMDELSSLDLTKLLWLLNSFKIVGFNSTSYDCVMLTLALNGMNCKELKHFSDVIITQNLRPYEVYKLVGVTDRKYNHLDLIEVAPDAAGASLKIYGGRLHCHKMQDLPFPPETDLTFQKKAIVKFYCINDLDNTILLARALKSEIELRALMSVRYKTDLLSKSDAQIAEVVIGNDVRAKLGKIKIPNYSGISFKYSVPDYLDFVTPILQHRLKAIAAFNFEIDDSGKITKPTIFKELITIGTTSYQMGTGGLHSTEESVSYYSDDEYCLRDRDVESYYPRIIINQKLSPTQLGTHFLNSFEKQVNNRLIAKVNKQTKVSDSLKIVINGTFGKLRSQYSIFYSPQLFIQVTLTGQLSLLMLIEALELRRFQVVSANTDGIVTKIKRTRYDEFLAIINAWERITNFKTEETAYRSLHSRDVNNYIAVKEDSKTKNKGSFGNPWAGNGSDRMKKNPVTTICIRAVEQYLTKSIPLMTTIKASTDIKEFIVVRAVKGGAVKLYGMSDPPKHDTKEELIKMAGYVEWGNNGLWKLENSEDMSLITTLQAYDIASDLLRRPTNADYLGKAVRWYYSTTDKFPIVMAKSGNMVPKSIGARPCLQMPDRLPDDIDYQWYHDEAEDMLKQLGVSIECG